LPTKEVKKLIKKEVSVILPYLSKSGIGLDVGCGAIKVVDYAIGIDLTKDFDSRYNWKPICDIIASAYDLPFKDNSISWIYAGYLLCDLEELEVIKSLKEWYRVLEPGGYLAVMLPDIRYRNPIKGQTNLKTWKKLHISNLKRFLQIEGFSIIQFNKLNNNRTIDIVMKKIQPIEALLVVAHPDDFILWASMLIKRLNWNWKVISITTGTSPDEEFRKVLKKLKMEGFSLGFKCERDKELNLEEVKVKLLDFVKEKKLNPQIVLTHNDAGEYGHQHHKNVNQIVRECFANTLCFDNKSIFMPFTKKEFENKLDLLKLFKSQREGFLWPKK